MIGALKQLEAGRKAEDVSQRSGVVEAHDLRLEVQVRRDGCERGAGSEAVARREHEVEKAGGGSEPGQRDVEGADRKKRMELVDRRSDADWLQTTYATSERRVCGLVGMAVASYRYRSQRRYEPLRTRLVELAREKPRSTLSGVECHTSTPCEAWLKTSTPPRRSRNTKKHPSPCRNRHTARSRSATESGSEGAAKRAGIGERIGKGIVQGKASGSAAKERTYPCLSPTPGSCRPEP